MNLINLNISFEDQLYNISKGREEFGNTSLNSTSVRNIVKDHLNENEKSVQIGLVILYIPAFIVGLLGNICLAAIIVRCKSLQNAINLCLCNLAVADLSGKFNSFFQRFYFKPNVYFKCCNHFRNERITSTLWLMFGIINRNYATPLMFTFKAEKRTR